ncbi:PREDICTED: uncharacterized protein LOC104752818 isoform X2 [Camelina sativa]|uniref:Uncharacterized protein LOC104752818 isoform X2 n=1 Tax=Camelina sativa TaxID=90675 RepID=A0ABM1R2C0_CAMSA|nr:PREDICTED: uncharacterized protein LOC104752818 isoform X2 [Camelina sativa]
MDIEVENIPRKLEAKFEAMVVCCILGVGQLVAWNTILTISDYYYQVFRSIILPEFLLWFTNHLSLELYASWFSWGKRTKIERGLQSAILFSLSALFF